MDRTEIKHRLRKVSLCGLLTSVMLILGYVESLLPPLPLPGIKLGLSNSVLVFALYLLDIPTAFLLMGMKVTLSGLLFGGVSAMAYAFAGGLLSMAAMSLLRCCKGVSVVVTGMVGGMMHNVGQVALAMLILKTPGLRYYMAVLMAAGLLCGALSGSCAKGVMSAVEKKTEGDSLPF